MSDTSYRKIEQQYFRVPRESIIFISWIIQAYEGVGILETIDSSSGVIVIHTPVGSKAEVLQIIQALKNEYNLAITPLYFMP